MLNRYCYVYYALPEPFTCMTRFYYHLVTEVPWPWHLRHRCHDSSAGEWYLAASLLVIYYHVGHLSCGAYGCILDFQVTYRVIVVCALHPFTWSWSLHPVIIEVTPLVHVEAAPQLMVHTIYIYSYDTYELVAIFPVILCYSICYFTYYVPHDSYVFVTFYDSQFTASTIFSYLVILDLLFIRAF